MSYSFSYRAGSKADAKTTLSTQLDEIVAKQPIHAADRDAAQAAGEALIDVMKTPAPHQVISVGVTGSCYTAGGEDGMDGANLSIDVTLRTL